MWQHSNTCLPSWSKRAAAAAARGAQVKRVIILGDGKVALVEVPVEGYSLPTNEAPLYDRIDPRRDRGLSRAGGLHSEAVCSRLLQRDERAVCVRDTWFANSLYIACHHLYIYIAYGSPDIGTPDRKPLPRWPLRVLMRLPPPQAPHPQQQAAPQAAEPPRVTGSAARARSIMYVTRENEEAQMEKYRFYVELPGDLWEDGTFMDLVRMNAAPLVGADGRVAYKDLLQAEQCHCELQVIDPNDSCAPAAPAAPPGGRCPGRAATQRPCALPPCRRRPAGAARGGPRRGAPAPARAAPVTQASCSAGRGAGSSFGRAPGESACAPACARAAHRAEQAAPGHSCSSAAQKSANGIFKVGCVQCELACTSDIRQRRARAQSLLAEQHWNRGGRACAAAPTATAGFAR
jgi:hypothetical protein